MVLLNRLENYAEKWYIFTFIQFGFKEKVSCTEASFTIPDTINRVLERGSTVFGCLSDARKALYTARIDCLLYKLLSEFGIIRKTEVKHDILVNF